MILKSVSQDPRKLKLIGMTFLLLASAWALWTAITPSINSANMAPKAL